MNKSNDVAVKVSHLSKHFRRRGFQALSNLNFEATRGEIIGITGGNGAGKSTLLRVLASVIKPSSGTALVRGPVVALLDPTCGFHRELTGRENIFFAGGLLGMRPAEVRKRLESIVDFAEAGSWVDWRAREVSVGMWTRLALSVGLHLEGETMLLDEVLGVGDFAFQDRCKQKIRTRSEEGKTVLFVSHDKHLLQELPTRKIEMHKGTIKNEG